MNLQDFRATRQHMTIGKALMLIPSIQDLDLGPEFTHVSIYEGDYFILHSRRGGYLMLETDEYETRDLPVLEFLLWMWAFDEGQPARELIWS